MVLPGRIIIYLVKMDIRTDFRTWLILSKHASNLDGLELEKMTRPLKVGKYDTPENLNEMTLGKMIELSEIKTGSEMFYKVCCGLLGMNPLEVDKADAVEVVRFVGWVAGSVNRINKLFDSVKNHPTQEEVQAGIERLNYGIFGLIDWYAKRMGIVNHDDVLNVHWGRVYQCLKMDNETEAFRKRLDKIYSDKIKRGHK